MRKQLLKGFAMLMAIMAFAMVTAVASANGQSRSTKANVPFEFAVGDQNLAAGVYRISSMTPGGDALRIVGSNTKSSALRLTIPAKGTSTHAKLVFHRYGERYFLSEVWTSADDGRELMKSRQERAIQKEFSRISSIQGGKPSQCNCETVEIAVARQ